MKAKLTSLDRAPSDIDDPARQAEFLRRLAADYNEVYAAGLVIVGNRSDADDVIQEVCVVLWQKYAGAQPILNFRKWACTVAFHVAKNHVRKQRRWALGLSDYAMSRIEQVQSGGSELFELRRELLDSCIEKLSERDQRFLDQCYRGSHSFTDLARLQRTSVETIYTRLKRVRKRLADCVQRTLGKGS